MRVRSVGDTYSTTVTFAQRDFDEFARLSGDVNPIHVDPEFSARSSFGRTVAHGMMLFGVLEAATTRWLGTPITTVDIAAYAGLIDDPNPSYHGEACGVPPPLLGGLISCLLGVDLPGPGTNWLKQRYTFHQLVSPEEPVTGRVEIIRIRPEKALVNLHAECTTPRGVAVTGEALVLVADLHRPPQAEFNHASE